VEIQGSRGWGPPGKRLSRVEILVLAQLRREPAHGYAILGHLREQAGWKVESGTLYPALRRLVERGLIKGHRLPQDDKPDAIEYQLTPKGQKVLSLALQTLGSEMHMQDQFLHFLSGAARADTASILFNQVIRNPSPIGFAVMKHTCCGGTCSEQNLEFLVEYKEYLQKELQWVNKRLENLKNEKDAEEVKHG
jgi:DNA-binding PadR family transcriptional regulator